MALRYHQRLALIGFLFTLPALLFFAVFSAYPMGNAFYLSLTNYDLVSQQDFVGLRNYLYLLKDPNFTQAALVTGRFVLYFAPAVWVLSFLVASLLQGSFRGRNFFRTLFFAPSILSLVGMSVIWRIILNRQGPINALLGLNISWLTERHFALLGIAIMEIWRNLGFFAIMFLVGMQTISQDYYDAAKVDGASSWQSLRWVTLPLLRPTFALVFIITIIHAVKIFTPMYIMTEGGPSNATRSAVLLIYRQGLEQLQMGLASAESIVLFVVILILSILQLRVFRVGQED
jgi:ABC-type sugar transport system permease subunit